jgi:hypothetical protein
MYRCILEKWSWKKDEHAEGGKHHEIYRTKLTHGLRHALIESRNASFQHHITCLTPDDHSMWKATKKFKRPTVAIPPIRNSDGDWARTDTEKACTFADYLAKVFTPLPANNIEDELEINALSTRSSVEIFFTKRGKTRDK